MNDTLAVVQDVSPQNETVSAANDEVELVVDAPSESETPEASLYLKSVKKLAQIIPEKLDSMFRSLRIPTHTRDFVVEDLKMKLDQAPPIISKANAQGGSLRIYSLAGMGISQLVVDSLRTRKIGKLIPLNGRFGLVLGGGITILRLKQNGKNKILIRFFADVEKVDKIISWMLEAFAGGSLSKVSAQVEDNVKTFEKVVLRRTNLGFAGQLALADQHFEHALGIGLSLPPVLASTYFYETQVNQYRINFILSSGWIQKAKDRFKNACSRYF